MTNIFSRDARRSLRNRMILWAIVFVLPIFLILFISTNMATRSYEAQMQGSIQQILSPFAREIDVTLDNAERYVASKKLNLIPLHVSETGDELGRLKALEDIGNSLAKDLSVQPLVDGIFFFDQGALQFVQNYNRDYARNRSAGDYLKQYLSSRDASSPLFQQGYQSFEADGNYYFFIGADLGDEGGVFGLWFNTDTLLGEVQSAKLDGLSMVMFADHAGHILNEQFNTPSNRKLQALLSGYLIVTDRLTAGPFTLTALMDRGVVFEPFNNLNRSILLALTLASALLVAYFMFLRGSIIRPLSRLTKSIDRVKTGDFRPIPIRENESTEIRSVYQALNAMTNEVESLKIRVYEEKLTKQNAQMQLFQLQLRPHFFLNALNTILSFARADQYQMIQKMTLCLATHCRYILYNSWFVSVEEELVYTQNYIDMQSMQHDTRYHYVVKVEEESLDREIPILCVQIFVENALKHSWEIASEIEIVASIEEALRDGARFLSVAVDDTGVGFSEDVLQQLNDPDWKVSEDADHGIGIENVRQRLQILYDNRASIAFSNNDRGGAHVEMFLPVERRKEGKRL
jgi:two-component system sensor histidine kinase YesM